MVTEHKTDQQIVDECNELAHTFYGMHGNERPKDFKFYEATHPQEVGMWAMACAAYDHIEGTDVQDILDNMEGN